MPRKKADKDVKQDAEEVVRRLNKEFGVGTIVRASDEHWVRPVERFSCGSLSVDIAMGGGIPRGRVTHLYGGFSTGKSTLALNAVREMQRLGEKTLWVVMEEFSKEWAEAHGVDLSKMDMAYPASRNEAVDITEQLVRSDEYGLIIYDSLASGSTISELERSATQNRMVGTMASLASQLMGRVATAFNSKKRGRPNQTSLILLNQLRMEFSGMFAFPRPTGGYALKHYPSVSVMLHAKEDGDVYVDDGTILSTMAKDSTGNKEKQGVCVQRRVYFRIEKNKTDRPFLSGNFVLNLASHDGRSVGVDVHEELVRLGVYAGLLEQSGAWLTGTLLGKKRVQGAKKLEAMLRESPKMAADFRAGILEAVQDARKRVIVTPEDADEAAEEVPALLGEAAEVAGAEPQE